MPNWLAMAWPIAPCFGQHAKHASEPEPSQLLDRVGYEAVSAANYLQGSARTARKRRYTCSVGSRPKVSAGREGRRQRAETGRFIHPLVAGSHVLGSPGDEERERERERERAVSTGHAHRRQDGQASSQLQSAISLQQGKVKKAMDVHAQRSAAACRLVQWQKTKKTGAVGQSLMLGCDRELLSVYVRLETRKLNLSRLFAPGWQQHRLLCRCSP